MANFATLNENELNKVNGGIIKLPISIVPPISIIPALPRLPRIPLILL